MFSRSYEPDRDEWTKVGVVVARIWELYRRSYGWYSVLSQYGGVFLYLILFLRRNSLGRREIPISLLELKNGVSSTDSSVLTDKHQYDSLIIRFRVKVGYGGNEKKREEGTETDLALILCCCVAVKSVVSDRMRSLISATNSEIVVLRTFLFFISFLRT